MWLYLTCWQVSVWCLKRSRGEVTEAAVESQILNYFSDPHAFEGVLRQFDSLHHELRKGASEAASAAITELLNRS